MADPAKMAPVLGKLLQHFSSTYVHNWTVLVGQLSLTTEDGQVVVFHVKEKLVRLDMNHMSISCTRVQESFPAASTDDFDESKIPKSEPVSVADASVNEEVKTYEEPQYFEAEIINCGNEAEKSGEDFTSLFQPVSSGVPVYSVVITDPVVTADVGESENDAKPSLVSLNADESQGILDELTESKASETFKLSGISYESSQETKTKIEDLPLKSEQLTERTQERPFECNVCGKCFKTSRTRNKHLITHSEARPYACEVCGQNFKQKYTLNIHKQYKHSERPYKCSECDKNFVCKRDLTSHQRSHTGEKPFSCDICGKFFRTNSILYSHVMRHNTKDDLVCDSCGRHFSNKMDLKQHVIRKHSVKTYECSVCGKGYPRQIDVDIHMRSHTGEQPFVCDTCGQSFASRAGLKYHIKSSHSMERPFQCSLCDQSFITKTVLQYHENRHKGVRPHKCDLCDKAFYTSTQLNFHKVRSHTDIRPYKCVECGKDFVKRCLLNSHVKKVHQRQREKKNPVGEKTQEENIKS